MRKLILAAAILLTFTTATAQELKAGESYQATIKTSMGNIVIKLYNDTPIHRDNFVKLAQEGFYDDILFHRVIEDFIVQCGDPDTQLALMTQQYGGNDVGYKLPAEIVPTHHHFTGAVAAAREGDDVNPERKSSGSQFYIVVGRKVMTDSVMQKAEKSIAKAGLPALDKQVKQEYMQKGGAPHLDGGYTVFGEVLKGLEVADEMTKVKTDSFDRPRDDVYIKSISIKTIKD